MPTPADAPNPPAPEAGRREAGTLFRYLVAGGWNLVFGVSLYWALYAYLGDRAHYLLLSVPANILSITNAFLGYKLFVFRTKGGWLREYFRTYLVYGASSLAGMAGLYILVSGFGIHPVAANVSLTGLTAAISYCGHRLFSFRPSGAPPIIRPK